MSVICTSCILCVHNLASVLGLYLGGHSDIFLYGCKFFDVYFFI